MADFRKAWPSSNGESLAGLAMFGKVPTAPDFEPLPPGVYTARVVSGEFAFTKTGQECFRMKFEITEGEHKGRICQRVWTFTQKALPYAQRDLAPFGLKEPRQLLMQFPEVGAEYYVQLVVSLQHGNDGSKFNDIKRITLLRVDPGPLGNYGLNEGETSGEGG